MSRMHSPADRALTEHRGIYQPHRPGFWLMTAMLVVGAAFGVPSMVSTISGNPVSGLLAIVLTGAFGALVFGLLAALTYPDRKPTSVSLAALGVGALFATAIAPLAGLPIGHMVSGLGDWANAVTAATSEETYKAIGLIALYLSAPWWWRRPIDGMILGALVGLGFQIWEDIIYVTEGAGGSTPDVGESLTIFFDRVLLSGLASHAAFTALFGAGIGYAVTKAPSWGARILGGGLGLMAAWGAHFFWDSPLFSDLATTQAGLALYSLIKTVPILLVVWLVARWDAKDFAKSYRRSAQVEVDAGALQADDVQMLLSPWKRTFEGGDRRDLRRAQADLVRLHFHELDTRSLLAEQRAFISSLR